LLTYQDGRTFASAVTSFFQGDRKSDLRGRILLEVFLEGQRTVAALDTGGIYFICDPELIGGISTRLTDHLGEVTMRIRGVKFQGELYLLSLEIPAEQGEGINLQVTAFIPKLEPGQVWDLPSFIGYQGALDRLRFAIDPSLDKLYFGPA
jgi:hypothetical protein